MSTTSSRSSMSMRWTRADSRARRAPSGVLCATVCTSGSRADTGRPMPSAMRSKVRRPGAAVVAVFQTRHHVGCDAGCARECLLGQPAFFSKGTKAVPQLEHVPLLLVCPAIGWIRICDRSPRRMSLPLGRVGHNQHHATSRRARTTADPSPRSVFDVANKEDDATIEYERTIA